MSSLTPAWVLHQRDYRNTSALVDVFCHTRGCLRVVAKGVKRKPWRHWLRPFTAVQIDTVGQGDLFTLTDVEPRTEWFNLPVSRYYCGFYLNELLLRALPKQEAHPDVFVLYEYTLQQLATLAPLELCLRQFEWQLLQILGYGVDFVEAQTRQPLQPQWEYVFQVDEGFVRAVGDESNRFKGADLLTFAQGHGSLVLPVAKRLMRLALISIIGDKPLMSRQLFVGSE
ncbi:MAG: DNA repair protein RecO [Legionellales bacterium]|nr:DNA repair protein RecO [Legionellales bacterium]